MKLQARDYTLHIALILALLILAAFGLFPEKSDNERKTSAEIPLTLQEYLTSRRNYFLGHREMSDLLTGLDVVATSVDMFQNAKIPESEKEKLRGRFEDSLQSLKSISKWATGMNDAYTFPSMYLLFEDQDPERALEAIQLGIEDTRTSAQVPLLAAFLAHVFLRRPELAGQYYELVFRRHANVPQWINNLAQRLKRGDDPYDSSPIVRKYILSQMEHTFPRAKGYFEQNQKLYEERRTGNGKPNPAGEKH
jgi:hypothetical protein